MCRLKDSDGLIRQPVDEVEIDRTKAKFAHPIHRLLRHFARLNPVNRFLHFRIKILHAERCAVETGFAQGNDVVTRQTARINFHARLDVV